MYPNLPLNIKFVKEESPLDLVCCNESLRRAITSVIQIIRTILYYTYGRFPGPHFYPELTTEFNKSYVLPIISYYQTKVTLSCSY